MGGCPPAWQQPLGDARGSSWTFPSLGSHSSTKAGRCKRPISDTEEDVDDDGIARLPVSSPEMGDPMRGMRPASAGSSSPLQPVVALSNMRENALARPLSVEAPEFSPALDPRTWETRETTMAPVDFAGLSVLAVPGMQFSAVAEVHSSAVDLVDDTLVVQANGQQNDGSGDPRRPPGMVDRPVTNLSTLEPLEHSVLEEDLQLDGEPMEGLSVPEPLEHSVLGENLDNKPMKGLSVPEPLEHSVPDGDLDGRPMEGLFIPEPLEHSVPGEDLDGRPMEGKSGPGPLAHSVPDVFLERRSRKVLSALEPLEHSVPEVASDSSFIRGRIVMGPLEHSVRTLPRYGLLTHSPGGQPDPLEHSGLLEKEDGGRDLVSLEPLEHSVLGAPLDQQDVSNSNNGLRVDSLSACCLSVVSGDRGVDVAPLDGGPEVAQTPPEAGDAIVVGAVGSAAPWFLTGWAHEVEVEFMIDTGCQVTILATTIFEWMCTADPRVRSRLRPCRRRLVSADLSPLTVKGELELNVVFPAMCCDMLIVVANIGSDGLLGTEALQSCLPH